MIRCVFPRGSRAAKWLTAVNRSYTSTIPSSDELEYGSAKSTASAAEAATSSSGIQDENDLTCETGRLDKIRHGRQAPSKPSKPRQLPISPFMDPDAIAARKKYKGPKLPPSKARTLFQQQLARNPYAQALATPVRQCQVTDTRLPAYFLQNFGVMAHPETREPWWVPTSLRRPLQVVRVRGGEEELATTISGQDLDLQAATSDEHIEIGSSNDSLRSATESDSSSPKCLQSSPLSLGPNVYTLSRQALLTAMKKTSSGWNMPPWKYFLTGSTKSSAIAKKVLNHTSWRTDMEDFVLELMRRRVVESLVYLVQRKRGYVAGCVNWEDATMAGRQQGIILWTGKNGFEELQEEKLETAGVSFDGNTLFGLDEDGSKSHYPGRDDPPGFATLTIGKDKPHVVPVHNLPLLLGERHLESLRKKSPIFNKEVVLVRHKRITVDVQMKLWKLQGYIAFPEVKPVQHGSDQRDSIGDNFI